MLPKRGYHPRTPFISCKSKCRYSWFASHIVRGANPAWTSWLAKQIYCPQMKLNTHEGIKTPQNKFFQIQPYIDVGTQDSDAFPYKVVI